MRFTLQMKDLLLCYLVPTSYSFKSNGGKDFGTMMREKGPNKQQIAYNSFRINNVRYTQIRLSLTILTTQKPHFWVACLFWKLNAGKK